MKKKVSLKDIAKEVGVSVATVSYALSKDKENKVSQPVLEKVKKVARELNYQPNQIAKSLKSGKSFSIGLILADISNPFFAHVARIIEDEAAKRNYTVIIGSSDEKATKSWDLIKFLMNRQVDGFIIAPAVGSEEQIKYLKDQNIPFVLIDRYFPEISTNYVGINNFEAAYNAVERLIATGNSKIGMIAYANPMIHIRERIRGYRKALEDHNLTSKENWVKEIDYKDIKNDIRTAIDDMLMGKERVRAIFFATNTIAIHGLKYIDELNYKVPKDVSIVSFDEGEAFDFYYCPLTHVRQPLTEFGKEAVKILLDAIIENEREEKKICLKADLVVRKSCSRG